MTLTLGRKKNALKDSGSLTESCQFPIAFTPMIYGSIFVEQQMCSRFDEEIFPFTSPTIQVRKERRCN